MAFRDMKLLVGLVCFFVLSSGGVLQGRKLSVEEDLELERQLKVLNKPAVKTIKTEEGDLYDCVDIYKQPAFDHPLLKNHKIQLKPSLVLESSVHKTPTIGKEIQVGLKEGVCPSGTVPIRRTHKQDLIRGKFFGNFRKRFETPTSDDDYEGDEHRQVGFAAALIASEKQLYGTSFWLNLWGLGLGVNQSSSATTWVQNGNEVMSAGWMVNPTQFGDNRTRMFQAWTKDNFKTGCINMLCPGFVQINERIPLGISLSPLSTYGGVQHELLLRLSKDLSLGNWWLFYGGNKAIGYWPKELFTNLGEFATNISWGGEVVGPYNENKPPMGSGDYAELGFSKACYFRDIQLMDKFSAFYDPEQTELINGTDIGWYQSVDVGLLKDPWRHTYYFGGPGMIYYKAQIKATLQEYCYSISINLLCTENIGDITRLVGHPNMHLESSEKASNNYVPCTVTYACSIRRQLLHKFEHMTLHLIRQKSALTTMDSPRVLQIAAVMESGVVLILAFLALIISGNGVGQGKVEFMEEDEELERQLKILNKPGIKTITTEHGDIYDCVDIYKQPAFDHPLLKNHKLQMRPSFMPFKEKKQEDVSMVQPAIAGLPEGGCPQGYVPIRRTQKDDLVKAKKLLNNSLLINNSKHRPIGYISQIQWRGKDKVYGTSFFLNLWALKVDKEQYTKIGCFNTLCPGFVQLDGEVAVGNVIEPVSEYRGEQYEVKLDIFMDLSSDGTWWLVYEGNNPVGYWPSELFTNLSSYADLVSWGGCSDSPRGRAKPPMGSGHCASKGFTKSCYMKNIQLMNMYRAFYDPKNKDLSTYSTPCYGAQGVFDEDEDSGFTVYFGGPADALGAVMEFRAVLTLVFLSLTIICDGVEEIRDMSEEEDVELERQLQILNKPAIQTIQTEYGDIFDCVDVHKQPAFDHPSLKNHKLKMRPSFLPETPAHEAPSMATAAMIGLPDGGCPQGSVPIRRTKKQELKNAKTFFNHSKESMLGATGYEPNIALVKWIADDKVFGTRFFLNIWGPNVDNQQYSAAITWLVHDCDLINAGWMVNPGLFGDYRTRLFIAWTADCYKNTGCFQLSCPGFVQIDTQVPIGVDLGPNSVYKGTQYELQFDVFKV
ncbi:hypothetical protein H6P81_017133 [Aristolochia fimbriata]|uniref:Neprosin PEP catalytic domain-containing protein n=1 Tax=Aristolochia fimbriata TaxID=158543 RepID=A0AAV7DZ41_ARIFI|nr:hypothetical protein H6P81_017133 [Aristolochia fimbriata]